MTIKFTYEDPQMTEYGTGVRLEVQTDHEHLDGLVESFKRFLLHVGHHPNNIARVAFEERQQALPVQLDLFDLEGRN